MYYQESYNDKEKAADKLNPNLIRIDWINNVGSQRPLFQVDNRIGRLHTNIILLRSDLEDNIYFK
jgi:hypothetical protein